MADSLKPPVSDQLDYKPLAPLALAGFLISCVYVAVLAIAVLVAFSQGKPLIFASWTLAVPFVSAALCYVAIRQIRAADDTRAGLGLARKGLTFSLLAGIAYTSYWLATDFAISTQASQFADKWFEKIKAGDIDAAYLDFLPPGDRQTIDPHNRDHLEARFNRSDGGAMRGALTSFRRQDLVRLVSFDPANTHFRLQNIVSWEPYEGGYLVRPHYVVSGPEGDFDLELSLHGTESPHKEFTGRQWRIRGEQTRFGARRLTPVGEQTFRARKSGREFFESWVQKYMRADSFEAFLDTRPPAERDGLRREAAARTVLAHFAGTGPLTGGMGCWAPGAETPLGCEVMFPSYRAWCEGATTDSTDLWGSKNMCDAARPLMRTFFRPVPPRPGPILQPDPAAFARVKVDAQRVELWQDCTFVLSADYAAEGVVILQTDAASLASAAPQWQIIGAKMDQVKAAPSMMSQMLGAYGPGSGPQRP
jgi:hypothetical protein